MYESAWALFFLIGLLCFIRDKSRIGTALYWISGAIGVALLVLEFTYMEPFSKESVFIAALFAWGAGFMVGTAIDRLVLKRRSR